MQSIYWHAWGTDDIRFGIRWKTDGGVITEMECMPHTINHFTVITNFSLVTVPTILRILYYIILSLYYKLHTLNFH
jgi:hypothetical protein